MRIIKESSIVSLPIGAGGKQNTDIYSMDAPGQHEGEAHRVVIVTVHLIPGKVFCDIVEIWGILLAIIRGRIHGYEHHVDAQYRRPVGHVIDILETVIFGADGEGFAHDAFGVGLQPFGFFQVSRGTREFTGNGFGTIFSPVLIKSILAVNVIYSRDVKVSLRLEKSAHVKEHADQSFFP